VRGVIQRAPVGKVINSSCRGHLTKTDRSSRYRKDRAGRPGREWGNHRISYS